MRGRVLLFIVLAFAGACSSAPRAGVSTGVTDAALESSRLVARVKTALLNDQAIGARRIDVQVTGADVRLTGRVASEAERDRAVQIAKGVEGVRTVTSSLEIKP